MFKEYYNVNDYGLWEKNKYVLIKNASNRDFARKHNLDLNQLENKILDWKKILKKARLKRSKPNLDDKVLTSWNALMVQGYLDAYKVFQNEDYLKSAIRNANFLIENQLRKDGGLNRNFKNGRSTINAYSEDYAVVIKAFI